jgi:glucokinase
MKTSKDSCVLAIDAGGTTIKAALIVKGPVVSDFFEMPVSQSASAPAIFNAFEEAAFKGAACASDRGLKLSGIGVCIPGPFDYLGGVSQMTHKFQAIRGLPLRPSIQNAVPGLPVRFMHDSSAFLLGELAMRPKQEKDICAVIIGTGLGFACTREGRLFENESGGPGISIFRRPFREETAEEFVSKRGIMRAYSRLGGSKAQSVKEMAELARLGDTAANRAFTQTGEALAEILTSILLENSFACMILGGQIAKSGALLTKPIQEILDLNHIACRVETAQSIDEAPLYGAAQLIQAQDDKDCR